METDSLILLEDFLNTKALEGCSKNTLSQYRFNIKKMLDKVEEKDVQKITTQNIRKYLSDYKKERSVGNTTLDNMRRNFNSYFSWCQKENIISNNPCSAVNKIKKDQIIKMPFSGKDLELLRLECKDLRERALVEVLYSTGMRVGELAILKKEDINWQKNSIIVFGKGSKEREVYLNDESQIHLTRYLDKREDKDEALFVSSRKPFSSIKTSTYEKILRDLGNRCDIKCHPHRFRRTCATNLLNKGMPIQEVSKILGHAKLETTMIYCCIDQTSVAANHKKYMN